MISDSFYRLGQYIARSLPLEKAYSFSDRVALIRYYFSLQGKKIIGENLRTVMQAQRETFDRDKITALTREVYMNFGRYLVEFFRFKNIDKDFINQRVKIVGLEYIDKCLKEGRGVITLSAHLGNWELGAAVMAALGYKLDAIRLKHKARAVNNFFDKKRRDKGVDIIDTGYGIKECYKSLKNNHILATVGDKNFSTNGEKIRFFGKITEMPRGAAFFSYRMNTPIIPTFMIRQPDNTFLLSFEEPIIPDLSNEREAEIEKLLKKGSRVIEDYIGRYKTQWLMYHRVWNT
jgi:KDO2-lipid IV(A) lauroyltransferase